MTTPPPTTSPKDLTRRSLWRPLVIDIAISGVAVASSSIALTGAMTSMLVLGIVACIGLLVRRQLPLISVAVAIPALCWGNTFLPLMVALFTLGTLSQKRGVVSIATTVAAAAYLVSIRVWEYPEYLIQGLVYGGIYTALPALFGSFVRARRLLAEQLLAAEKARHGERVQAAQVALAQERAVLAREMHDVVSHQVSLIAVQAGALQMTSPDDTTKTAARTIRALSVTTLEELRTMVEVLRAAGGHRRDLAPQPTVADLDDLFAASDIAITHDLNLPTSLPAAYQRAIYRTVQEGLTNARKHSTGAPVTITGQLSDRTVILHLDAGPATMPLLQLPSAHHGIRGLGERAETLGGTIHSTTYQDGSHRLTLRLPL